MMKHAGGKWMLLGAVLWLATLGHARPKVVAYVPNWIDLPVFAERIDYAKLTHINVAFENPTNAEGDLSFNAKNGPLIERAREKGVKILISIGGGSAANNATLKARYFDLISAPKRGAFAVKLADYVVKHKFDGLDVDIEGPSINADYGAFIAELAKVFRPKGLLLTAALSRGYGGDKVPESAIREFDFINIMAYDAAGTWAPDRPGQHSSFEYARANVDYWLRRGLPKEKAILGVPFYGYGFGAAFRKSSYSYAAICAAYPGAEHVDEIGSTIWYNGIPTIRAKACYTMENGLGGMMIWSLDNDVPDHRSLLATMHAVLSGASEPAPAAAAGGASRATP